MARSDRVRLSGDRIKAAASPPSRAFGANAIFGGAASQSPGWCGWGRAQFTRDLTAGASASWHLPAGAECPEGAAAGRAWPDRVASRWPG